MEQARAEQTLRAEFGARPRLEGEGSRQGNRLVPALGEKSLRFPLLQDATCQGGQLTAEARAWTWESCHVSSPAEGP